MNLLMFFLLFQGPAPDGQLLEREPYSFPFESHSDWLNAMNGKGLDDWSEVIGRADFERFQNGKTVHCHKITYSSDGLKITGFLLVPHQEKKPVPAIIFNRGGTAQWGRITFWEILEMHRLAEKGYVVVASYLRGVGGSEGKPELGGGDIRDTLNLIPLLESIPEVDASRIGMWGFSRGGTTTYMSMKKTDRIAAAVVIAGSTDSVSSPRRQEFETHVYPGILAGFEDDPEAAVKAVSAIHWADRLPSTAPILLLHGTADKRVQPGHTLAFASKLQNLGRDYRLVMYQNGSHSLIEHFLDVRQELDDWFDRYLAKR